MKKAVVVLIFCCIFLPLQVSAQTQSECSSIEQTAGSSDVVVGESSPANVLMRSLAEGEFEFVVNANPGRTVTFIQLVYNLNGTTHIVMPDPSEDFSQHWQTSVVGDFHYYKVIGCWSQQASITTVTTTATISASAPSTTSTTATTTTIPTHQGAPVPVVVAPHYTG